MKFVADYMQRRAIEGHLMVKLLVEDPLNCIPVYFNEATRSLLQLPYRKMGFFLASNTPQNTAAFKGAILRDLGINDVSSFELFGWYPLSERIEQLSTHSNPLAIWNAIRNDFESKAFFQMQPSSAFVQSFKGTIAAEKSGYLMMKSNNIFKKYRKEWILLRNHVLYSNGDPSYSNYCKKIVDVRKAQLQIIDHKLAKGIYGIALIYTKKRFLGIGFKRYSKIELFSDSKEQMEEWIDAISRGACEKAASFCRLIEEAKFDREFCLECIEMEDVQKPCAAKNQTMASVYPAEFAKSKHTANSETDADDLDFIYSLYTNDDNETEFGVKDAQQCAVCKRAAFKALKIDDRNFVHLDCFKCCVCEDMPLDHVILDKCKGFSKFQICCRRCYDASLLANNCHSCHSPIRKNFVERFGFKYHPECCLKQ